jgi:hypothetical protein
MKAILVGDSNSSPAPNEYEDIPEVKKCKPEVCGKTGYVEVSLQKLDDYPKSVILVQWMGAKNGFWYPASDIFRIVK